MGLFSFRLSFYKDEIQERQCTFLYEAKGRLQVHLEETLGSCVLRSVFTGLLLLSTERQDARTAQEVFFSFCESFLTKICLA